VGSDSYEKNINDYFWLYKAANSRDRICLGTIDYGQYRLADAYKCFIKEVGWDKSFLLFRTERNQYFIQDLRSLKGKSLEHFGKYLYGPFNEQEFISMRDSFQVDKELDFEISY
jgi:hypothetical protein